VDCIEQYSTVASRTRGIIDVCEVCGYLRLAVSFFITLSCTGELFVSMKPAQGQVCRSSLELAGADGLSSGTL